MAIGPNSQAYGLGPRVGIHDVKGNVLARLGDAPESEEPGHFIAPHGVCINSKGDIFVGEVSWTHTGSHLNPPREVRSLQKADEAGVSVMAQPPLNGPYDPEAVDDYKQQARDFLAKGQDYLAAGDLHQASEKGWGAAAWMTKAVAVTHGWEYERHEHFSLVLNNARALTGLYAKVRRNIKTG